jgi:rare lipoprotein A
MNMSARIRTMWTVGLLLGLVGIPVLSAARDARGQTGTAVYYSDKMNGKDLSLKGETYDKDALTAATHKGYPLGSKVRVTNISNNKSVTVKVNDRMNPRSKAVIDLSRRAAEEIDMIHNGHVKVRVELIESK